MKQAVEMPVSWEGRKTIELFSALPTRPCKSMKPIFTFPQPRRRLAEQSFHLKDRKTCPNKRSHRTLRRCVAMFSGKLRQEVAVELLVIRNAGQAINLIDPGDLGENGIVNRLYGCRLRLDCVLSPGLRPS